MEITQMPKLQPVPIRTKGKKWWEAIWTWINSRRKWEFSEDWVFKIEIGFYGSTTITDGMIIMIPKGYEFDGASIPRVFWWLLSPVGILLIPSVFHDYCYTHGYLIKNIYGKKERIHVDRNISDELFRNIGTQVNGMPWINGFIYWCLHLFAGIAWWNCRYSRKSYGEDDK